MVVIVIVVVIMVVIMVVIVIMLMARLDVDAPLAGYAARGKRQGEDGDAKRDEGGAQRLVHD